MNTDILDSFLTQFELCQGAKQIEMSAAMARHPYIKKLCNIENNHGRFLGISIKVVPDMKAIRSYKEMK